jgi:hypothetical protein
MNDDEYHQAELERERESEEALNEALEKGVSKQALMVLAREAGCVSWALQQSLKG